jgi:tRNA (cmo5U34)-methyltransferase
LVAEAAPMTGYAFSGDQREPADESRARASSLGHVPSGPWAFDDAVTAVFEDMLQRSIPQYDVIRGTVHLLARDFVRSGKVVVDLGASSGEGIAPLVDEESHRAVGERARFVAIECSPAMLKVLHQRFAPLDDDRLVTIMDHDLRRGLPDLGEKASLVLSVLTLQFVPMEYRQQVIRSAYEALAPGGAMILVEKVLGSSAALDTQFVSHYLHTKMSNGYSAEEVDRKRLSLEGVLVPVTARWNEEMLQHAGFSEIDCFWRWLNFAGWLALKN